MQPVALPAHLCPRCRRVGRPTEQVIEDVVMYRDVQGHEWPVSKMKPAHEELPGGIPVKESVDCPKWGRRSSDLCEKCPFFGGFMISEGQVIRDVVVFKVLGIPIRRQPMEVKVPGRRVEVTCKYRGELSTAEVSLMEKERMSISRCSVCREPMMIPENEEPPYICRKPGCVGRAIGMGI